MRKAAQNHFSCFTEAGDVLGDLLNFFGGEEEDVGADPLMVLGQDGGADKEIELAVDLFRPLNDEILPFGRKDPVLRRDGKAYGNGEIVMGIKAADTDPIPRKVDGITQLRPGKINQFGKADFCTIVLFKHLPDLGTAGDLFGGFYGLFQKNFYRGAARFNCGEEMSFLFVFEPLGEGENAGKNKKNADD